MRNQDFAHGLRVVMLAAEATPYAKVGGLGDVVGVLPKALAKLGAKTSIIIPAYRSIDLAMHHVHPCKAVPGFDVPMDSSLLHAEVMQSRIDESSTEVFLIGLNEYFDRDGIYDDPVTGEGYPDSMQRFIFFMRSGVELLSRLGHPVDIVHCHDSHTALIPGIINLNYRQDPVFSRAGTLFTIHNLAYQGLYPKEALDYAGIDSRHFHPASPFEYWGQVNFMKAGIELADKVNTVSKTYAVEIKTDHELGMGLEGVLRGRHQDFSGIVNGIDYDEWNPEKDPRIPAHYSSSDLSGKLKCREYLLQYFGLPSSHTRIPLIGIVSRMADQKGFDLISAAAEDLASLDMQLIVLGMGQKKYEDMFRQLASRYPAKIAVRIAYDNDLAHKIVSGCDLFLMPSKFEPCGLNQLHSLRYGTIPIVRITGGLADTVTDYGQRNGTGFRFQGYTSREMMETIRRALAVYPDPVRWQELMIRAMSQDCSWDRSALEYLKLYKTITMKYRKNTNRPN
jgi:starch synthase